MATHSLLFRHSPARRAIPVFLAADRLGCSHLGQHFQLRDGRNGGRRIREYSSEKSVSAVGMQNATDQLIKKCSGRRATAERGSGS